MRIAVDPQKLVGQHPVERDVTQPPAASGQRLSLGERLEAQRHEELQGGDLGLVFFGGVESAIHEPCHLCIRLRL